MMGLMKLDMNQKFLKIETSDYYYNEKLIYVIIIIISNNALESNLLMFQFVWWYNHGFISLLILTITFS